MKDIYHDLGHKLRINDKRKRETLSSKPMTTKMTSEKSDTPRTEIYVLNPHPECVSASFARELEHELNKVTEQRDRAIKIAEELQFIPPCSVRECEDLAKLKDEIKNTATHCADV